MSGGNPYRKVVPGETLKVPARAWNELMRGLRPMPDVGGEPIDGMSAPYQWVYAKATGPIDRWSVLAITGMDITPAATTGSAARQFESMPIVTAAPTGATGPTAWGVTLEPIAGNKLGRLAVAGVVQVKASEVAKLGNATVIWQNGIWALVSLGGGGSLRLGTIGATWTKGQTATVTEQNGDGTAKPTGTTFEAVNYFATITVSSGTRRVACGRVDSRWLLIAAECS